jgi:hypothetical protein
MPGLENARDFGMVHNRMPMPNSTELLVASVNLPKQVYYNELVVYSLTQMLVDSILGTYFFSLFSHTGINNTEMFFPIFMSERLNFCIYGSCTC